MTLMPTLLIITATTSIMFIFLKHPLTLGLTLILQTLLICLMSSMLTSFTWFSYILFMIFLGATLVLFIYVASLAPNEFISISNKATILIISSTIMSLTLTYLDQLTLSTKTPTEMSFITQQQIINSPLGDLSMMYNPPVSNTTTFIIIYLLMTLIIVVNLTSTFYGPLRLS